jgi:hypothetical protein
VFSLAKSFSERLASLSPRNNNSSKAHGGGLAPPSSLALGLLGPTAAGGSAPGSGANSPSSQQRKQQQHGQERGGGSGAATPTRTILQRFHTAPSSPMGMGMGMGMGMRSPSSYRATMGEFQKLWWVGLLLSVINGWVADRVNRSIAPHQTKQARPGRVQSWTCTRPTSRSRWVGACFWSISQSTNRSIYPNHQNL